MKSRQVLVVDDDIDALKLIGLTLEHHGFEILAAANGEQAIQKAIEIQPDLIILDVMMPGMDGYEVASRLRSHPATEAIPILMFTAKGGVNDKIAGFQAGADEYLTKPVHPRELVARVQTLLQRQARTGEPPKQEAGKIIGFLPVKGGIGTTTLTLNTVYELKRMHPDIECATVELKEGGGTLALQMGAQEALDNGHHLAALLEQPLPSLTKAMVHEHLIQYHTGFSALPTVPQPIGTGIQLSSGHVRTILRYLGTGFDYLLLDMQPQLGTAQREALQLCDLIVVTLAPNRAGLMLAQEMLKALQDLDIDKQRTKLALIHRMPALGTISQSMIKRALKYEIIATISPSPDLASESIETGRPMVEIQSQGLIVQQVRRLVQSFVGSQSPSS